MLDNDQYIVPLRHVFSSEVRSSSAVPDSTQTSVGLLAVCLQLFGKQKKDKKLVLFFFIIVFFF